MSHMRFAFVALSASPAVRRCLPVCGGFCLLVLVWYPGRNRITDPDIGWERCRQTSIYLEVTDAQWLNSWVWIVRVLCFTLITIQFYSKFCVPRCTMLIPFRLRQHVNANQVIHFQ